ncbi:hypothetical protein FRB96_003823 [Tulasnella sp. 330]|nr:hypothetical protein FRB96_003823 [Tulasnella sp. 330]KAG8883154.1 hypothetical protein FRB97_007089 [Tulasnella sp. 331]KAG8888458.1 hypothetical protein FRB98_007587 [Tulasnella sp. 332]
MPIQSAKDVLDEFVYSGEFQQTLQALINAFDTSHARERLLRNIDHIGHRTLKDAEHHRTTDDLRSNLSNKLEESGVLNKTLLDVSDELLVDSFMDQIGTALSRIIVASRKSPHVNGASNGRLNEPSLTNGISTHDYNHEMTNDIESPSAAGPTLHELSISPSHELPVEAEENLTGNGTNGTHV